MIIKSLHITDFCGTKDRTVELAPGFNVIEGENESGKTTLASFIKFIFYGLADKAARERYMSWGSTTASGSLTLCDDTGEYRIERECTGPGRDAVKIIDMATGSPCFEDRDPADVFLGVPADVFEHSAYVGQMSGGEVDGEKVSRSIQNILFSADERVSAEKARKKIDDARILLYYKNQKGGRIYDLKARRDDLLVRHERAKSAAAELAGKERDARETREQLDAARAELAKASAVIESSDRAAKQRGLARLKEQSDNADRARAEYEALCADGTREGFLPDAAYVAELEGVLRDYRAADAAYRDARADLDAHGDEGARLAPVMEFASRIEAMGGRETISDSVERAVQGRRRARNLSIFFFIFAALCLGAAAAVYFPELPPALGFLPEKPLPSMLFAGAALVALIFGIAFIIKRSQARIFINEVLVDLDVDGVEELERRLAQLNIDETRLQIHHSRRQEYENRLSECKMKRDLLEVRLEGLLARWGASDADAALEEASKSVADREARRIELDKFELARDTIAGQLEITDVAAALADFDPDAAEGEALDPERLDAARREYEELSRRSGALTDRLHAVETDLAVMGATRESTGELADELRCVTEEIDRLTKKHTALVMAYNELTAAENDLRESVSPRLAKTAGGLIAKITGGKYDRLGVSSTLGLAYDAGSQSHGVEYMSAGTRDVAYLSLRFALIDLLYEGKVPPLIFDESFSRLDDNRYKAMLSVIGEMTARGVQTLLFTSQTRDALFAAESDPDCRRVAL